MGLVVGVAGERLTGRLNVKILAQTTTGNRMEAPFNQFHWVRVTTERFGGWRLGPVLRPAKRKQRTEARSPYAEAAGQSADGVSGRIPDIRGSHHARQ